MAFDVAGDFLGLLVRNKKMHMHRSIDVFVFVFKWRNKSCFELSPSLLLLYVVWESLHFNVQSIIIQMKNLPFKSGVVGRGGRKEERRQADKT